MSVLNILKLKTEVTYYRNINGQWIQAAYLILDILCIFISAFLVFSIRFAPEGFYKNLLHLRWRSLSSYPSLPYYYHINFLILYIIFIVLVFKSYDLYRSPRGRAWKDEALSVLKGVSLATLILMIYMYLFKVEISRFVVLASYGLNLTSLVTWRYFKRKFVERRIPQGCGVKNVLIVGAGKIGHRLAATLEKNWYFGFKVKGFIDDYRDGDGILGQAKDLPRVLQLYFIDEVFITIPSERELVKEVVLEARKHRVNVKVIPELFDGITSQGYPSLEFLDEFPIMDLYGDPIPEIGLLIKRAVDIVGAIVGIVISTPLMLAIAIAIKIDSPDGPIVYRSRRMGRRGRIFDFYKFRTMVPNADTLKDNLRYLNERSGPLFKITKDPRTTSVGRFLRKYSLDEVPQFFNVLEGNMSLVGPRPHALEDFRQYNLEHYRRLDIKPGLTSLWAIEARDDPSFECNMALDLYYIENWNLWLDLTIMLRTIILVLKGVGI